MGQCSPKTAASYVLKEARSEDKKKKRAGYHVEHFIADHLVPVEFFTCRQPRDVKRARELRVEMKAINESLVEDLSDQVMLKKMGRGARRTSSVTIDMSQGQGPCALPSEVLCRVFLDRATLAGSLGNHRMDLGNEVQVKVKVYGYLLFPPEVRWYPVHGKRKSKYAESHGDDDSFDHRWRLDIEVWLVLEQVLAKELGDNGVHVRFATLTVKCLNLKVQEALDYKGDPVVDSWLPHEDILQDIETQLGEKLTNELARGIDTSGAHPYDGSASRISMTRGSP